MNPRLREFYCKHLQEKGRCHFNESCMFSHSPTAFKIPDNVCIFFLKKYCSKTRCSFLHIDAAELVEQLRVFSNYDSHQNDDAPSTSKELTDYERSKSSAFIKNCQKFGIDLKPKKIVEEEKMCGICMEDVAALSKKFGLLSNCNHMFCFSCIMTWRKTKIASEETTKGCPECRKISDHVFPSNYFAIGDEKKKIIERFKSNRKDQICKFEKNGVNNCRKSDTCFYKHTLPFRNHHLVPRRPEQYSYTLSNANIILNHFFSDSSDDDFQIILADASFI